MFLINQENNILRFCHQKCQPTRVAPVGEKNNSGCNFILLFLAAEIFLSPQLEAEAKNQQFM